MTTLDLRTAFRFGTWNILSLGEQGCDLLVVRELSRLHLSITALTEVRWPGSGTKTVANSTMLWSGRSYNKRTEGVALALDPSASRALISWRPISERLLTATFKHRHGRLQVIACYAPTNSHIDANKNQTLTDLIASFARHDIVVVLGDLNATIGSDRRGYESVLGPHSSGSRNDNGERLLDLCALHRLKITSSWFRRRNMHRWTWISNDGRTKKELDYIIVSARWNIVQNCRVYRSADCGNNTDHRLVAATCSLRLKRCSLPQDTSPPIAIEKLLEPTTQRNFVLKLHNRFALLSESDESASSIENLWKEGRNALKEMSHAVLGPRRRKKHQWISDETLGTIDEHRTARLCGNKVLARRLATKRKQQLRRDEAAWYNHIAGEAEDANRTGNSAVLYHTIRTLTGRTASKLPHVTAKDGSPLCDKTDQLHRWKDHFQEQFNNPALPLDPVLMAEAASATPDPSVDSTPSTADKISAAIRKLKKNRAPGICGITAELLKSGGVPVMSGLLPLFTLIWKYCVIPTDWNLAIILPLWKGKGSKSDCTKYRGISLLSVPAKVFAHICLARMKRTIFAKQRPQQSHFTPGQSTLDRIVALRLLAERRLEYRQPLYAAYIDLRAAFDSLDRNSLWNILKTIGIPPKLVDIIKTLYSPTHSVVRVNGTISEAFSISSGVRQGCVLAANLFNTATDRILNNTTQALTLGVNYDDSGQLITDLDYADDIVIFADLLDTLKDALFIFNEQSQKLGLHVNWSKTKLQSFSPWIPTPPSTLMGTQPVTTTDNFTYLGSTIASNNSSDVNRRIAIATSTMSNLSSLWTSSRLSLALKMRLYNSLIISIITYSSASWTLTKAQKKRLDAFNTKALRRILGVRWYDYVTNASILIRTGHTPLNDNNPQTTSKCLRTHLSSTTRHSSHQHSGLHPTYIMVPTKRTSTTPLGRPNHQRYPDVPE